MSHQERIAFRKAGAQLGNAGLGDAGHAHSLHKFIDATGADAADPRLLDHCDQRFLDHFARFEEAREIAAGAQLGDFEV